MSWLQMSKASRTRGTDLLSFVVNLMSGDSVFGPVLYVGAVLSSGSPPAYKWVDDTNATNLNLTINPDSIWLPASSPPLW